MASLTIAQTIAYLKQAGFQGAGLIRALAVALAENGGNLRTDATNTAGNVAGTDRGLFQINSYYHSEVSDACAFDPACAAKAAFTISKGGTDFSQWTTWPGAASKYLLQAANAVGGATVSGPTTTTGPGNTVSTNQPGGLGGLLGSVTQPIQAAASAATAPLAGASNTLGGIAASINGIGQAVSQAVNNETAFINWLDQPNLWVRVGLAVLGIILLLLGLVLFALAFLPRSAARAIPVAGAVARAAG